MKRIYLYAIIAVALLGVIDVINTIVAQYNMIVIYGGGPGLSVLWEQGAFSTVAQTLAKYVFYVGILWWLREHFVIRKAKK